MKSTLEAHTDCLLTKLEGSAGAHFRIEPTCIIITLSPAQHSSALEREKKIEEKLLKQKGWKETRFEEYRYITESENDGR